MSQDFARNVKIKLGTRRAYVEEVGYYAARPTYELAPIGAAGGSHSVCISAVTLLALC